MSFLGFRKDTPTSYFFALNIGESQVSAALWSICANELDILGQSTLPYLSTDDLIDKAHRVLDSALGALEVEPTKILFGVPDAYLLEDNLKEPYLKLLRRMVKEYDLEPMAYVSTTHAIAHLLQKQEGVPPTTILVGVGDSIAVSVVKAGKVVGSQGVKRSDNLFDDIEKTLMHFSEVEVLPSKLLLYATSADKEEDIEKLKDELTSFPWMQKLPFLHFPKIDALRGNIEVQAIVVAGAVEVSPDVDFNIHVPLQAATPDVEDFGFVSGDIRSSEALVSKPALMRGEPALMRGELDAMRGDPDAEPLLEDSGFTTRSLFLKARDTFLTLAQAIKDRCTFKRPSPILIAVISVILLLISSYLMLVKAEISVFVEPRVLERTTQVVSDPASQIVDESNKVIPGNIVETTVTGSTKGASSGKKQIGEAARGKVVIYNLTSSKVSLLTQTTLTAKNSLKFTLDSPVQIASQSSSTGADLTTVIKPGKTDQAVGINAGAIGPEGNLPAGSELTVAGYPSAQVIARVDEALSGGTSKDVTVVTAEDQKRLQAQLLSELRKKAQEELQAKLTDSKKIIPEALTAQDPKYSFNKKINDTASEFSLTATIHFKGTAYSDSDLKVIVAKLVETNVPEGFELNLADTQTQADVAKVEKDGKLIFLAKFKANLLPKLNTSELKKGIRGKSVPEAIDQFKGMEGVLGAEVKLTPNVPAKIARLPLLQRNINIIITPK